MDPQALAPFLGTTVVTVDHEQEVYTGLEPGHEPLTVTAASLTLTAGKLTLEGRMRIALEKKEAQSSSSGFVAALKRLVGRKITDIQSSQDSLVLELERGARLQLFADGRTLDQAVSFQHKGQA